MIETIIAAIAANTVNFAKINSDNIVEDILVLNKTDVENWQSFIGDTLGRDGTWVQDLNRESANKNAAIGKEYVPEFNQFRNAKPDSSLELVYNVEVGSWLPIAEIPADADILLGFTELKPIESFENAKKYFLSEDSGLWEEYVPTGNDPIKDFINSRSFPSFVENDHGFLVPPIPQPQDGKTYSWDEPSLSWIEAEPTS